MAQCHTYGLDQTLATASFCNHRWVNTHTKETKKTQQHLHAQNVVRLKGRMWMFMRTPHLMLMQTPHDWGVIVMEPRAFATESPRKAGKDLRAFSLQNWQPVKQKSWRFFALGIPAITSRGTTALYATLPPPPSQPESCRCVGLGLASRHIFCSNHHYRRASTKRGISAKSTIPAA